MNINTSDRTQLRGYFQTNSIPTQSNFEELINGMLNQKDDGIVKLPDNPLSIQASGDGASLQKVINFYKDFKDPNPAWTLSLNPRSKPSDSNTAKSGFSISDGQGNSRLFIDATTGNVGNVGIGTTEPKAKLDVNGGLNVTGNVGIGTANPKAYLDIRGQANCLVVQVKSPIPYFVNESDYGGAIYFGINGDNSEYNPIAAIEAVYGRVGNPQIAIGVTRDFKNNESNRQANMIMEYNGEINIRQGTNSCLYIRRGDGNVGIGTTDPQAKLHVKGKVKVEGPGFLNFDGQDDYVELPTMNPDLSEGFTVEVWVYYRSFKSWSRIIDFGSGQSNDNIVLANYETGRKLIFQVYNKGVGGNMVKADDELELNTWMHLAATVDKTGQVALYKNGQKIKSGTTTAPATEARTSNYIGKSNWPNDYFDGQMRELRIWSVARTDQQIKENQFTRMSGSEQDLIACYRLDPDKKANDLGPQQWNGGLFGGPQFSQSSSLFFDNDTGSVGIGTESPKSQLAVAGGMAIGSTYAGTKEAPANSLLVEGNVQANNFPQNSDLRAKKDIEELHYGLEELKKLRPVMFNWRTIPNPHKNLGLIAQEVQPVIQEVVYMDDSAGGDNSLSIAYANLIPVLINAIKQLDSKISNIAARRLG